MRAQKRKNRAVFLDRDGTVNREVDNLKHARELRLLPNAAKAIAAMTRAGFIPIIVTNQPVVARGWITEEKLRDIHSLLLARLVAKGARVAGIYYCPHHPHASVLRYRVACACRKPGTLLFKKAAKEHNIDLKKSFAIGDRTADILAGKKIGAKTILLKTGYGGKDGKHRVTPDFTAKDLLAAARIMIHAK